MQFLVSGLAGDMNLITAVLQTLVYSQTAALEAAWYVEGLRVFFFKKSGKIA